MYRLRRHVQNAGAGGQVLLILLSNPVRAFTDSAILAIALLCAHPDIINQDKALTVLENQGF